MEKGNVGGALQGVGTVERLAYLLWQVVALMLVLQHWQKMS
jgi:hypothetical protein